MSSSGVGPASGNKTTQETPSRTPSSTDGRSVVRRRRRLALFGAILVVTFLSRVPFLDAGYGAINDTWRVARAAREIATTGQYEASRFPPHPLQELVCSLLWRGGPVALNAATALLSSFAVLFFALSMVRLGIGGVVEASAALAFAPVILINSTNSSDYLWSLSFILGSLYLVLERKPILAGIFLGLAIGSRITAGAMLLPLLILAWRTLNPGNRAVAAVKFVAAAGIVGVAFFVPVFLRYGWGFLTFVDRYVSPREAVLNATVGVWGRLGATALFLAIGWWIVRRSVIRHRAVPFGSERRTLWLVCIVAVALYAIAFVRLPHLAAYLIPAMPFTLLVLAMLLERPVFRTVCIAVVLSSFVYVGRSGLSAGPIFRDHRDRMESIAYTEKIVEVGRTLTRKSIIVAGKWVPQIEIYVPQLMSGPVQYVYLLDAKTLRSYQTQGFDVYFLPGQTKYNLKRYGVDLPASGVRPLIPESAGWHW
jgi:hypothetical protein